MSEGAGERQRFGRYETLFRIAGGGMAEVYAARALGEAGFQKLVALKRMRPELAEDPKFVTMFLDEGRVAANIVSPNVVQTLDLGRAEDNSLYLVMELLTGVALQDLIDATLAEGHPIPVPMAVSIVAQVANGLHDAHEAIGPTGEPLEIVHRDCSPHNVLVDVKGQVKVTDFGIAKALERQTQSHAGEMKGKLLYLSPEQARGQDVDRRSDIFIVGIVAWEILARRLLFEAENAVAVLHRIVSMPIPRLDEVNPEVPTAVADAVHQALARDADERFETAAAFGNALLHALGQRTPSRSELGAFVRAHGGPELARVEAEIHAIHAQEREERRSERPPSPGREAPPPDDAPIPPNPPPRIRAPAIERERAETLEAFPDTLPGDPSVAAPAATPTRPAPSEPPARPRVRTEILESQPPPPAPGPDTVKAYPVSQRRRPPLLVIGVVLVLLSGGGAALVAWYATRPAPPEAAVVEPAVEPVATPPSPEDPTPADDPPEPTITAGADVPEAPPEPAPEATPTPAPRARPTGRRRRPSPDRAPPRVRADPDTVGGTPPPGGDRAAAIDEIPWED